MSDDRQIALMGACGLWFARANGAWLEDGHMAIRVAPPFEEQIAVSFHCTCSFDQWHLFDPALPCIKGPFKALHTMTRQLKSFLSVIPKSDRRAATASDEQGITIPFTSGVPGDERGRRFDLDDGRWFAVQERFYQGVVTTAQPDAWEALFKLNPRKYHREFGKFWDYPFFAALRAGEHVGYIMPVARPNQLRPRAAEPPAGRGAGGGE